MGTLTFKEFLIFNWGEQEDYVQSHTVLKTNPIRDLEADILTLTSFF